MKKGKPYIGIIGGSGIYDLDNISNTKWQKVSSKFGILNFNLKGSSEALSKAWECAGKYQEENASIGNTREPVGNSSI